MTTTLLSADDLRRDLARAVERFTAVCGVGERLAVAIPPTVARAADVLAVDLPTLVAQLAFEHGWPSWSIRYV